MATHDFPLLAILLALERAARYRRDAAIAAGAPAGNLSERIDAVPGVTGPAGDGWYAIGAVHDGVVDQTLRVVWHPASNRVRIARPATPAPIALVESMPALSRLLYGPPRFHADRRYRYFLKDREYAPEDAERIATERDSRAGWTWRRRDR